MNGSVLDVAIGILVLFLVPSVMASAVVETIGGFLHRRQKHLWDSLDLLLGNTSAGRDPDLRIVHEIYKTPFVTGLVRPTDRRFFDPANPNSRTRAPRRGLGPMRLTAAARNRAAERSSTTNDEQRNRRFYGPAFIAPTEFANALLAVVRPGGEVESSLAALKSRATSGNATEVAIEGLRSPLDVLRTTSEQFEAHNLRAGIERIEAAGRTINVPDLRAAVDAIDTEVRRLTHGELTRAEVISAFRMLPTNLQTKLGAVLAEAGDSFVEVRTSVENWFDRNMTASSQWYRRQTRWFLFIAGFALACTLNIDAVQATATLYRDRDARSSLVAEAQQIFDAECIGTQPPPGPESATADQGDQRAKQELACLRDGVDGAIRLPIGWTDTNWHGTTKLSRPLGWLAVAAGVTLGAPFWFDLLGRALKFRSSKQAS